MKLKFLGTGTSQGVPMIGGGQDSLDQSNPKNWRTRTAAHIEVGGLNLQIDAGPEFRLQCIANDVTNIDYFFLTHGHADHIVGMDDLRRFCDYKETHKIPVFASEEGAERVRSIFPYALKEKPVQSGYPCFDLQFMPQFLELENGVKVHSCLLPHGDIETLGFVVEYAGKRIAYYNDTKLLTPRAIELAMNADIVVLDGLRPRLHPSHMSIFEAIEAGNALNAKQVFYTHTTWEIDYETWSKKIPENAQIAYDGLVVEI